MWKPFEPDVLTHDGSPSSASRSRRPIAAARVLIVANTNEPGMPQLAVRRPLDERHLHDDVRPGPVCAQAWQSFRLGERRRRCLDRIEAAAQVEQKRRVETGADFPGEDEV